VQYTLCLPLSIHKVSTLFLTLDRERAFIEQNKINPSASETNRVSFVSLSKWPQTRTQCVQLDRWIDKQIINAATSRPAISVEGQIDEHTV